MAVRQVTPQAQTLREAIAASNLTTAQLLAKVGCTRKSLTNWRGGQKPSDYYIGRLSEVLGVDLWHTYTKEAAKTQKSSTSRVAESAEETDVLTVGGMRVNWCVIALDRFRSHQIRCTYDRAATPLPPDLEHLCTEYLAEWERHEKQGEIGLPFNSPLYKLKAFHAGFREMIDGEEVPVLRLRFGPTDYFTQIVTDLNVENPMRNSYRRGVTLTEHPVPQFASLLGVNLSLITKDNYLIVSERNLRSFLAGGKLHTSVAENMQRPLDGGVNGAPDPFRSALRGAHEELGIELDAKELEFGAFGVEPTLCQYSLFGAQRLQLTRDEIMRLRNFGIPKDKWESSHLIFVPYEPEQLAAFVVETWDRWLHIGLAAVILSLWHMGHSLDDIDAAFARARG